MGVMGGSATQDETLAHIHKWYKEIKESQKGLREVLITKGKELGINNITQYRISGMVSRIEEAYDTLIGYDGCSNKVEEKSLELQKDKILEALNNGEVKESICARFKLTTDEFDENFCKTYVIQESKKKQHKHCDEKQFNKVWKELVAGKTKSELRKKDNIPYHILDRFQKKYIIKNK